MQPSIEEMLNPATSADRCAMVAPLAKGFS